MEINFNLTQEITRQGLDEVKLLDEVFKIRTAIIYDWGNWKVSTANSSPDFIVFTYKNCIEFIVNIHVGLIVSLRFSNAYEGKLFNKVAIGDMVKQLLTVNPDIVFDEHVIAWDDSFEVEFEIDNDSETIPSLEEVLDNKITTITVRNYDLSFVIVAADQMPESWIEMQSKRYGKLSSDEDLNW